MKQQWALDEEIVDDLAETGFAKAMRILAGRGDTTTNEIKETNLFGSLCGGYKRHQRHLLFKNLA